MFFQNIPYLVYKHITTINLYNYIKNKPSYANFLKHVNKLGLLLKHLVDLKIVQNLYVSSVKNYFLDSTKMETCKTEKRKTKSQKLSDIYLKENHQKVTVVMENILDIK